MEECEALCTRLVIMVNGQFKCLGSPQHLKTKFGSGFKLSIRLNEESSKDQLFDFMSVNFPQASIKESHKNLHEYILPFSETKLSQIFGKIEKAKDELGINDYSVSQTTLDQIFVNFAKAQNEEKFVDADVLKNAEKSNNMPTLDPKQSTVLSVQDPNNLTNIEREPSSWLNNKQGKLTSSSPVISEQNENDSIKVFEGVQTISSDTLSDQTFKSNESTPSSFG